VQRPDLTRRQFVFILGSTSTLVPARTVRAPQPDLTAQKVIDRIRANIGMPWRDTTIDGFKAGDPATIVTGVATTVIATLDVLRRAAAGRQNLVITQEPTFYSANDEPGNRGAHPVYLAKKAFIDERRLVVWLFSDHWNARQPNESAPAQAAALGWNKNRLPDAEQIYQLPETNLGALVAHVRSRLGIQGGLRTIGKPEMRVRTVFISPGGTPVPGTVLNLRRADVVLTGEPREWEAVPYVLDTWSSDRGKGLIAVGRNVSEMPGMQACATWIRSVVPEVRVEAIAAVDPYWRAGA
jgi:putative NIF3 family GTP cyclohydrolase 1 type 2